MDSEKSRGNPESATQSALDFLRESLGAMPPGGGSRRWRFQRETSLLQEWAQRRGCCLSEAFLQDFRAVSSGAEHEVFFDQSHQRAIKVTRGGSFGHSMVGEGQSAGFLRRFVPDRCRDWKTKPAIAPKIRFLTFRHFQSPLNSKKCPSRIIISKD